MTSSPDQRTQKLDIGLQGFTIIEILIVLAIAGLILLIVFLAVPALQRNSRNTQRRNDVSVYIGAVNEFKNSNDGRLPATTPQISAVNDLANLGFLSEPTGVPPSGVRSGIVGIDTFELVTGAKCDPTNIGNTISASGVAFAVRYSLEDSSGNAVPQCQDG